MIHFLMLDDLGGAKAIQIAHQFLDPVARS
jgi:hypothetical protein